MNCGITKKEFFHSTMKDIRDRIQAYVKEKEYRTKEIEYQSWLTGIYVMDAVACCFSKNHKYPENPLLSKKNDISEISKNTGKSEAELIQEEQYFAMRVRQANANIANSKKKTGGD